MNKKRILITLVILSVTLFCSLLVLFVEEGGEIRQKDTPSDSSATIKQTEPKPNKTDEKPKYYSPVAEFKKRITKKKFGTYITLQNSPTQPERFTGYHTGVDVEYEDVTEEVPIHAITDGTVIYSGVVDGYGGVMLVSHKIDGNVKTVVYGHLNPASLKAINSKVKANQVIARLGDNRSSETDGERKHLHFAVLSDNRIDFKGYVLDESQLAGWINPLNLY